MAQEQNTTQSSLKSAELGFLPKILSAQDIFSYIRNFLDSYALIQLCLVNKDWCAMTIPIVFDHYQKKLPHPVTHGYLLKTIAQDFQSTPDSFSDDQLDPYQKSLFQRYMHDHFNENVDGSETFLDYINRVSQLFLLDDPTEFPLEIPAGHSYIATQIANLIQEISFLFNSTNIKFFTDQYDLENNLIKKTKEANYLFIIQYLNITKKIESFLTVLVLFNKVDNQSVHGLQIGPALKNRQWTSYLTGSGITALCTRQKTHSSGRSIIKSALSCDNFKTFTVQEARYLLTKINPSDLLAILPLYMANHIHDAINAKQPEILSILCSETRASDQILLFLIEFGVFPFIELLDVTPELAQRLRHPVFLKRFLGSNIPRVAKYILAEVILNRPTWVADLHHIDIDIVFELAKIALPTSRKLLAAFVRENDCFLLSVENDRSLLSKFTIEQITHLWKISKEPNKEYLKNAKWKTEGKIASLTFPPQNQKNAYVLSPTQDDVPLKPITCSLSNAGTIAKQYDETLPVSNHNSPEVATNEPTVCEPVTIPCVQKKHDDGNTIKICYEDPNSRAWKKWVMYGFLVLAGAGLLLSFLGLLEVPFAAKACEEMINLLVEVTPQAAALSIFIANALLGIITLVSAQIEHYINLDEHSTEENSDDTCSWNGICEYSEKSQQQSAPIFAAATTVTPHASIHEPSKVASLGNNFSTDS